MKDHEREPNPIHGLCASDSSSRSFALGKVCCMMNVRVCCYSWLTILEMYSIFSQKMIVSLFPKTIFAAVSMTTSQVDDMATKNRADAPTVLAGGCGFFPRSLGGAALCGFMMSLRALVDLVRIMAHSTCNYCYKWVMGFLNATKNGEPNPEFSTSGPDDDRQAGNPPCRPILHYKHAAMNSYLFYHHWKPCLWFRKFR